MTKINSILRRKGYCDVKPVKANKRVAIIGIHPIDGCFYIYHDLISKGIPFHLFSFTEFLAKYNTDEWKDKYDVLLIAGTYSANTDYEPATTNPGNVKTAMQAIIAGNWYKIIQVSRAGMERRNDASNNAYSSEYWFADMGVTVDNESKLPATITVTNDAAHEAIASGLTQASDAGYTVSGVCENVTGTGLTVITNLRDHTSCAMVVEEATKKWMVVGAHDGGFNINSGVVPFNAAIDYGKLVQRIRGIKSGICFNRINGKKYIAWGYDCDMTVNTYVIDTLREIQSDLPMELGLVSGKFTSDVISYYQSLQTQGVKIVSHTYTHFDSYNPEMVPHYDEYDKGIEALEDNGFSTDGAIYMTSDYTNPEHWISPYKSGYLLCGYRPSYRSRGYSWLPLGEVGYTDNSFTPATNFFTGLGTPVFTVSAVDDIANMRTSGADALNVWKTSINRALDNQGYELPAVFYIHDKPLTVGWNDGFSSGNYYSTENSDYMTRRKQFYIDMFNYIRLKEGQGCVPLCRSEAIELLNDIANCVSISGETITASNVTVKIVSNRRIRGLTIRVPNDSSKTVSSVTVEGVAVDSWNVDASNKWVYVGLNVVAGKEHTLVVNFS